MSYGQIDEHTQHHHRHDSHSSAAYGGAADPLRRSTIDMPPPAPPSLSAHSASTASTGGTSLTSDIGGQQGMSAGQIGYTHMVQGWNMLPTQSPKTMEFTGAGWYTDPNPLAKVQEDEVSHFGGDIPGGMFDNR